MTTTSSNITVLTSLTGGKDNFQHLQCKGNADFVAYTDAPENSGTWSFKPACKKFADPRRNSRAPKILSHLYCDTLYSIWIDANIRLLITPEEAIERYLKDHDLAVFKHPNRDCIYDEAMTCAKRGLDAPEIIIEQAKYYEDSGYEKHKGLYECGILLRRHTEQVKHLNNEWWAQYTRFSQRDQISFPYAVDQVGIRINAIPEYFVEKDGRFIRGGGIAEIFPHIHAV